MQRFLDSTPRTSDSHSLRTSTCQQDSFQEPHFKAAILQLLLTYSILLLFLVNFLIPVVL